MLARLSPLALLAVPVAIAACGPSLEQPPDRTGAVPAGVGSGFGGPHVMPVARAKGTGGGTRQIESTAKLAYYGGPVLSHVNVVAVYWSAQVLYQNQWPGFYSAVTNSAYFDWLSEYNTSTQTIGRGKFAKAVTDSGAPPSTSITDAQIQQEVARLLDAGALPANAADNLYMVHFPPGVSITQKDGSASCVQFCAYHGTFSHNGQNVYYGVIPDQGGACANGCGGDPDPFKNATTVTSHEVVEAVTDPGIGLATQLGPPLGWYDSTNGEIGDICEGQQGSAAGYAVQLEWSNAHGACIDHGATCAPSCSGKQCGSDGCGGTCGSCAGGASCSTSGQCVTSCAPSCSGKQCGPDGCGGTCGTCGVGSTCSTAGTCSVACQPSCSGKQCGSDGCGGSCGACGAGSACSTAGTCVATKTSCAHAICSTGGALTASCDSCAQAVCAQDSYCCTNAWDSQCVSEVATICGQSCGGGAGGTGSCAHALCSTGSKLTPSCDACAQQVCASDSYCCTTAWDGQCVSEVTTICGESC